MTQTERYELPLLSPGQMQKEWFHNEALQRIDALLCPLVEAEPLSEPPPNPIPGTCFAVGDGATGAWTGQDGALASFGEGGWTFLRSREGLRAVIRATGETVMRRDGNWEVGVLRAGEIRISGEPVVGPRQPAIAVPTGGSTVDAECRAAIGAVLAAMTAHGLIES
jgi:hypothetical protein